MWEVAHLRRNRRVILLFVLMVLLPALIFSILIIRAVRSEQMQVEHQKAERQRQIMLLVEADLSNWLFSAQADSAISRALFKFRLDGERIVFPEFQLSLPAAESSQRVPLASAPQPNTLTAETIMTHYYPRIQVFLRDLRGGHNSGAQFFLRLGAVIVGLPGGVDGYVMDVQRLVEHANQQLATLCAGESFTGALWVGDFRSNRAAPNTAAFALEGFPFFQVAFSESEPNALTNVRQYGFAYATALLVLVTILGSVFGYRAVSQEVRLSTLRSDFVSAVSHEFRSPLSSILALSERLESARVRDPDKLTEYHRVIGREGRRLSTLVTRLLDFAQIEDGKKVYSPERVDLVAIAREAIQACHYSVRPERIGLAGEETSPLWVRADPTALQHGIQNLIENAVKYSPPDSPVTVTCASVNGFNVVEVRDQGIGIPVSEQPKIFEKFYRSPQASALDVQGVGIGLALVKHVIERHGGSVSVESELGHGSRFRLHLPAAEV